MLNLQSQNCKEMVNSKLKHIRLMELNLDKMKTRIVDKIKDDKKTISMLLEQESV